MTQYNLPVFASPTPGRTFLKDNLEPWRDAVHSMHAGVVRPDYVVPQMMWVDISSTPWLLKMFQGSDDIVLGTLDPTTLVFTPSGTIQSDDISVDNSGFTVFGGDDVQQVLGEVDTFAASLGTAAYEDVGTATGDVVQLEDVGGSPGLPAVDGGQLTNLAVLQTQITLKTASQTTTATIPNDNTIPQITEGAEFFTCSITPKSANSVLKIEAFIPVIDGSALRVWVGALFRDSTSNAIATAVETIVNTSYIRQFKITAFVNAGSTSETTFSFRFGLESSGTAYANSTNASGNERFGNSTMASLSVTELTATL